MISRFTFTRGGRIFEVLVEEKWTTGRINNADTKTPGAVPIFLEEDDFQKGRDALALDFFLMKNDFNLLEGKDLVSKIAINKQGLRLAVEIEIRKLASSARSAFYNGTRLDTGDIFVTLSGLQSAMEYLKIDKKLLQITEQIEKMGKISSMFYPKKRIGPLLQILQRWENLVD